MNITINLTPDESLDELSPRQGGKRQSCAPWHTLCPPSMSVTGTRPSPSTLMSPTVTSALVAPSFTREAK